MVDLFHDNGTLVHIFRGRGCLRETALGERYLHIDAIIAAIVRFLIVLRSVDEAALRVRHLNDSATTGHNLGLNAEVQLITVDLSIPVWNPRHEVVAQTVILIVEAVVRSSIRTLVRRVVIRVPRVTIANAIALDVTIDADLSLARQRLGIDIEEHACVVITKEENGSCSTRRHVKIDT